jgi:nucleoside-diphosphate-sugar epimerase
MARPWVLVTGGQGFIASLLAPHLTARGYAVWAPSRAQLDVGDPAAVETALAGRDWAAVVHLAGLSHVPTCERDPDRAYRLNRDATIDLYQALRRHAPAAHFVFASTALVYRPPSGAEAATDCVLTEDRAAAPAGVYAQSKWQAEQALRQLPVDAGRLTIARLFNHTHKTQPAAFFLPHVYQGLRAARPGQTAVLPVGNLEIRRDLGAVADLVSALGTLVTHRWPPGLDVFNICSGVRRHLGQLAQALAARLGVHVCFQVDAERLRPGEPASVRGSLDRLTAATGWRPRCTDESIFLDAFLADDPGAWANLQLPH